MRPFDSFPHCRPLALQPLFTDGSGLSQADRVGAPALKLPPPCAALLALVQMGLGARVLAGQSVGSPQQIVVTPMSCLFPHSVSHFLRFSSVFLLIP